MKKAKRLIAFCLVLISVLSVLTMNITAADKKEVKKIVLSNYKYTVYFNETVVSRPKLTVASSEPYKPSTVYNNLAIYSDGKWKKYGSSNVVYEGTYRWEIQVRIEEDNAKKYKFAANPTVYVDGKNWSWGELKNSSDYSTIVIYSPSFKITKSNTRPAKTKIKSVEITVPTSYSGDKIQTSYANMALSGTGSKWSTVTMPKVYCPELQGGSLPAGTAYKKDKTYLLKLYVAAKDNYELTSSAKAKVNGKSIDERDITLLRNAKGDYELCISYSFTVKNKPQTGTTAPTTKPSTSTPAAPAPTSGGFLNTVKSIFKAALNFFKVILKVFK